MTSQHVLDAGEFHTGFSELRGRRHVRGKVAIPLADQIRRSGSTVFPEKSQHTTWPRTLPEMSLAVISSSILNSRRCVWMCMSEGRFG